MTLFPVKLNQNNSLGRSLSDNFLGLENRFFDEIESIFNNTFGNDFTLLPKTGNKEVSSYPVYNTIEYDDRYEIEIAAPGIDEKDLSLKLDGNRIEVSYSKETEHCSEENENCDSKNKNRGHYIHRSLAKRSFKRLWDLPKTVDIENISAKLNKGILSVVLPKKKEKPNKVKQIHIDIVDNAKKIDSS